MRIGIFGGTFDPPHLGHWLASIDAAEALKLDRVVWVPAAQQPLKAGGQSADAAHRLAMTRLAVYGEGQLVVDPIEIERGGVSYTVDTLRAYRERHADAALFLLLGMDAAAQLPKWREPDAIRRLSEIVVLTRGGDVVPLTEGVRVITTRRVDVSATEIRARVADGRSIRGFVTDAVAAYIAAHGLYR